MPLNTAMLSNVIAAKNVIYICFFANVNWNMKCERPSNLRVIQNCPPNDWGGSKNCLLSSVVHPLLKTDQKLNVSVKNGSLSVFEHIRRCQFGQKFGVGWKLRSSVDNCSSSYRIYTIYTCRYRVLLRSTVNNWCFDALTDTSGIVGTAHVTETSLGKSNSTSSEKNEIRLK